MRLLWIHISGGERWSLLLLPKALLRSRLLPPGSSSTLLLRYLRKTTAPLLACLLALTGSSMVTLTLMSTLTLLTPGSLSLIMAITPGLSLLVA